MALVSTGSITVVDIYDGAAGTSAISSDITNDNHTVPTLFDGTGGVFTGCATTMSVYIGTTDDSANWSVAASPATVLTGATGIVYTTSGKTFTVTELNGVDVGTITLKATRTGYATQTQVFTITKAKGGVSYQLLLSNNVIKKYGGVLTPLAATGIVLTAKAISTAGVTNYTGRFKIYLNGSGTADYSSTDVNTYTYTGYSATTTSIKFELYTAGASGVLVDSETILVVVDGVDGGQIFYGDAPPTGTLVVGQQWWDTVSGTLFLYYKDGSTPPILGWIASSLGVTGPKGTIGGQGALGPTVDIIATVPLLFRSVDLTLVTGQASIVLSALITNMTSGTPTYAWSVAGWDNTPTASTTGSTYTVPASLFASTATTNKGLIITCTVTYGGVGYKDIVTISRFEGTTAAAGATLGATWGTNLYSKPTDPEILNLSLLGSMDGNLIPDSDITLPAWWGMGTTFPSNISVIAGTVGVQPRKFFQITSGTFSYDSNPITVKPNRQYRVALQMYISSDFVGTISPLVHFPIVSWCLPAHNGTLVDVASLPAHNYATWGAGWITKESIVTTNNNATIPYIQTRIRGAFTAGIVYFAITVTEVADTADIQDKAITNTSFNTVTLSVDPNAVGPFQNNYGPQITSSVAFASSGVALRNMLLNASMTIANSSGVLKYAYINIQLSINNINWVNYLPNYLLYRLEPAFGGLYNGTSIIPITIYMPLATASWNTYVYWRLYISSDSQTISSPTINISEIKK